MGSSNWGKTNLRKLSLFRKQEQMRCASSEAASIYKISKSKNQYPIIETQTSDEVQSLEIYENSFVVFDDIVLSKQISKIDLFYTRASQHY